MGVVGFAASFAGVADDKTLPAGSGFLMVAPAPLTLFATVVDVTFGADGFDVGLAATAFAGAALAGFADVPFANGPLGTGGAAFTSLVFALLGGVLFCAMVRQTPTRVASRLLPRRHLKVHGPWRRIRIAPSDLGCWHKIAVICRCSPYMRLVTPLKPSPKVKPAPTRAGTCQICIYVVALQQPVSRHIAIGFRIWSLT